MSLQISKHYYRIGCFILLVNSIVSRIVMAVAEREGTDPTDLPPLFTAVDTESVETLLDGTDVQISFTYCGYRITVTADEELTVKPRKIHAD